MSRSLSSGILSILGAKVGTTLIGVVFTPLLIRLLSPKEYGQYAVLLSIFAFANILMTSGTNDAVRKFISEYDDETWRNAIFGFLVRPTILLSLLVSGGFLLAGFSGLVERAFGEDYVLPFYLLSLYAIGRQSYEFLMRTIMGLKLETISEPIRIAQKGLFAILALTTAYLSYGVEGVLLSDFIASVIVTIVCLKYLNRVLDLRAALHVSPSQIPTEQIYRYIGSTILFFGFMTTLYNVDILVLSWFQQDRIVGYYKGALAIAEMLWLVPIAVQFALLQRVSNLWKEGDLEQIQRQAERVTRYTVLFSILVSVGVASLAYDFVPLYLGKSFTPAVVPLLILLPGVVAFAIVRPTIAINQARRSLRPLIISTGTCAIINLVLNLLLIPDHGMIGAAVATSLGYGSLVISQSITARYFGYKPFGGIYLIRIFATTVISASLIFALAWTIESSLISLLIVPPVGFIIFVLTAVLTRSITREDLNRCTEYIARGKSIFRQ